VQEETLKEVEKNGKAGGGPDRVNPVRNSKGALNPAGIVLKSDLAAEQRGIISNGVKDYLENLGKKIEMKKSMENKISMLEEDLKRTEIHLVMIGEYERGNDLYYQPFKDPKRVIGFPLPHLSR